MTGARKRLLAPEIYRGLERESQWCAEAAQALDVARGLVKRVAELQLEGEEIAWFLAEALLLGVQFERAENPKREARAVAAALSGVRATLALNLQAQIDFHARRGE